MTSTPKSLPDADPRCGSCSNPAIYRVTARVPARFTSRLGNRSWTRATCTGHLSDTVYAAMKHIPCGRAVVTEVSS